MFDTWKSIFAGFSGKLKDYSEARKLVWLLIITGFFSLCCVFFAAYVSFSRYRDLAGILPGADIVAICFTVGIAGFIFFASSYIALFTAEIWIYGETNLSGARAITFFCVGLVVAIGDYHMNIDGAYDVAQKAVGQLEQVNEEQIRSRYASEIKTEETRLSDLLGGKLGGYGWKNTKTGVYHLNNSGKKFQRSISQNIERLRVQEAKAIDDERQRINRDNSEKTQRKDQTHSRLLVVVRSVYIIQFFLCLVMALIGVSMSEAMGENVPSKKSKKAKVSLIGFKNKEDDEPSQAETEEDDEEEIEEVKQTKKKQENPHTVKAQIERMKAEKKALENSETSKRSSNTKNAQILREKRVQTEAQKSFHFWANKAPDNTGKSYDVTPNQLRKIKRVFKAYEAIRKKEERLPTQAEIAARAKMSENTVRKYLGMMELDTKGTRS